MSNQNQTIEIGDKVEVTTGYRQGTATVIGKSTAIGVFGTPCEVIEIQFDVTGVVEERFADDLS